MGDESPLALPLVPADGVYDWRAWIGQKWVDWIEPDALRIAEREEAKHPPKKITAFACAGPAIASIWGVTYVQWGFTLLFPFVVTWISNCPEPWEPFAHYPVYVWLFFIPVVGYSISCEIRALKLILPTIAAYCAPFKVVVWSVSFDTWVFFIFCLSMATHADLVTNGLFLAKIRKTVSCHGPKAQLVDAIWFHTIQDAHVVSWIPGFDHLETLLLIGWGLMFLQPVLCLLYATPINRSQNVDYGMESMGMGYTTPWAWCFSSGEGGKLHHADVLQWLGTANRMVSITEKNLAWSLMRAQEAIDGNPEVDPNYYRAFDIVGREFARITNRLYLVNLLEKAYMLEVQVTIFAISRCLIPRDLPAWARVDKQMVLSVFLSFITFMKVVYDAYYQMHHVSKFIAKEVPLQYRSVKSNGKISYVKDARRSIKQTRFIFQIGFALLCLGLFHSSLKFVMSFVCKDSMWNMHNPFKATSGEDWMGCVDLSTYMRG